jgi:hypothetical protein
MPSRIPLAIAEITDLQVLQINGAQPGVYFLCFEEEVVYVGKSKIVLNRILTHLAEQTKEFDQQRIYFLPTPEKMLSKVEKDFIISLKPKYNLSNFHHNVEDEKIIFRRHEMNLKKIDGQWTVDIEIKGKRLRRKFQTKTEAQYALAHLRSQRAMQRMGIEIP